MPRVVLVGAGISGLSVAFRLQQRDPGCDITVLEQNDRVGGTLWTLRRDGFQVEIGPNGFLDSKPNTLQLSRDVGLAEQLVRASEAAGKNRYLFLGQGLKALPGGFGSFLRSDLLSWRGKLSLVMERFRRGKTGNGDESIDAFARRRVGPEAADTFVDGLVTGIFAGDPKLLSLPACFPRVAALEREHGSVIKGFAAAAHAKRLEAQAKGQPYQRGSKLWSFRGGLRVLVEHLRDRLAKPPILGVKIRRIQRAGHGWTVEGEGQERWPADAVVLTCPAHQQAGILADVDTELADAIAQIPYNRVAVVALGFRRSDLPANIDGFGFIAPQRLRREVLGVQWCSSIYPDRAPEGAFLLRGMAGGWHRADVVGWDDARLVDSLRQELRLAMGLTGPPIFQEIVRWDRAIPQYHVGHLARVAAIQERASRHPGLFLGGNGYQGVALNDCTEQGELLAAAIDRFGRERAGPRT